MHLFSDAQFRLLDRVSYFILKECSEITVEKSQ